MASFGFEASLWPLISRRLDEALVLPPALRDAWLAALDEPDDVKRALGRLLNDAHGGLPGAETDDFAPLLPKLTLGPDTPGAASDEAAAPGMVVGPYRLIRELGVGGMGMVWLAERRDGGLKRPVALKLPRVSWTRGLAERLARERDILARLDHPNIAQIFDAGLDEGGRPYLALEYVDGEPIDLHCRRLALPVAQRLQLLLQVARAVAHAHARLVVHRDLKPANILVTPGGDVRLLDFGIAKMLQDDATLETELTALNGRALTLDYASPEQVRGEPLGAASDVYSLGIVAYELLTGAKPYQLKRQSAAALEDAIATLDVRLASSAAGERSVARALRGDLDAILNRALKKDLAQRYPTVDALAQDIERHLNGLPVLARPDALGYRAGKFLRRNAVPVVAAGVTAAALVAGLSVALWQAHEARAQSQRAIAVQRFMDQVFGASDPDVAQGQDIGARELLRRGSLRLETDFKDQPDLQAELEHKIASILSTRGENGDAQLHFEKALALYRRAGLGDTDAAVDARLWLSDVLYNDGQFPASEALASECVQIAGRRSGPAPAWLLRAQAGLSVLQARRGDTQAAVSTIEQALAAHRRAGHAPGEDTANALSALGHAHMSVEDFEKAREAYTLAIAEWRLVPNAEITGLLIERLNLQNTRLRAGENEPAARELPDLVTAFQKYFQPTAPNLLDARSLWARALVATGHYDEGLKLQQEVVATAQAERASTSAQRRRALAYMLKSAGRYEEALHLASQELLALDTGLTDPRFQANDFRALVGELQRLTGHPQAALLTLGAAVAGNGQQPNYEGSERQALQLAWRAMARHDLGQADAATDMTRALQLLQSRWPDRLVTQRIRVLAAWMAARERPADGPAQARFADAVRAYATRQPVQHLAQTQLALLAADLQRQRADSADARLQWTAATQAWERLAGRPLLPPVLSLD